MKGLGFTDFFFFSENGGLKKLIKIEMMCAYTCY